MTTVNQEAQTRMDETLVDDEELVRLLQEWAFKKAKASELNRQIKDLGLDELKQKVRTKLHDFGIDDSNEPLRFRAAGTGIVVSVTPPGESKHVEFETTPKLQLRLVVEEAAE